MKLSKNTASIDSFENPEYTFKLLKDCGFSAADYNGACCKKDFFGHRIYDFSDKEFDAYFDKVKNAADKYGIDIAQTHATFECVFPRGDAGEYEKYCIIRCVRATSILGAPIMVTHPLSPNSFEEESPSERRATMRLNREFFTDLLEEAHKYGVKIALENMPGVKALTGSTEYLAEYLDMMKSDIFGVCLDTGHAHCSGHSCADMARAFADRLFCLHIHDNHGPNPKYADEHLPVGLGSIDWDAFFTALRDINYAGTINLENEWYKIPAETLSDACKLDAKIVMHYMEKYDLV